MKRKPYVQLFKIDKNDYRGWANGLVDAGYATDTLYAEKLIRIIEAYQLYDLDRTEGQSVAISERPVQRSQPPVSLKPRVEKPKVAQKPVDLRKPIPVRMVHFQHEYRMEEGASTTIRHIKGMEMSALTPQNVTLTDELQTNALEEYVPGGPAATMQLQVIQSKPVFLPVEIR